MQRIDQYATDELNGISYGPGHVLPFGATVVDGGVNFSIFSGGASACWLVLYHHGAREPFVEIPLDARFRMGKVYRVIVYDLNIETLEYGYRFDGPYDPAKGLYYDKNKVLLDPYARSVSGRSVWGRVHDPEDPFQHRGQVILDDFDWRGDHAPELRLRDLVIYEAHVRSMTRHPSAHVRFPGTYAGLREKIPYLKSLGINCIELMPIFEFDEFDNPRKGPDGRDLCNYWGYSTVCFFAPKAGYAASAPYGMEVDELKQTILEFHQNGMEVLLDVVFNHTAEGGAGGPYISYRGIDNKVYYLLSPRGEYLNFSGCGNTMNCNNALVRNAILDCLRYWVADYHVDGFRFDLASILSRDENGNPMMSPPLLESLTHDAVLGKCKLIAEAWDAGGLYQVGSFPSWGRFSEWNGRFRDCLRSFVKGGAEAAPELYARIGGSYDLYGSRAAVASINFVTCHDGFTLYDLVSYNDKHNEDNGEDGKDGSNDNRSWNCGVEGETSDPEILDLRFRQMKNMQTLLLTSRGVPMLLAGDEFANTQYGNNNAYCQDNEISWLNWDMLKDPRRKDLHDYVKRLLKLRADHPVLRNAHFDMSPNATGYPEVSFHSLRPWELDLSAANLTFACLFAEDHIKYGTAADAFLYVLVNAHWEAHSFTLPVIPAGLQWHMILNSDSGNRITHESETKILPADQPVNMGPRSSAVLVATAGKKPHGRKSSS